MVCTHYSPIQWLFRASARVLVELVAVHVKHRMWLILFKHLAKNWNAFSCIVCTCLRIAKYNFWPCNNNLTCVWLAYCLPSLNHGWCNGLNEGQKGRFSLGACWEFIASIMLTDITTICKAKVTKECLFLPEHASCDSYGTLFSSLMRRNPTPSKPTLTAIFILVLQFDARKGSVLGLAG